MKQVEVRKELARARAGLYRFLGGLYIMEVDEETLANMKQMQFPTDCANEELAEAYRGLEKAIADLNNEDLEDVAADYEKEHAKNVRSADVPSRRRWLCMRCMAGSRVRICSVQ